LLAQAIPRADNSREHLGVELKRPRSVFDRKFLETIVTRMDANSEIFKRILDDDDFRELLGGYYVKKVYEQLRETA